MHRGRGNGSPFFEIGDPFAGFGGLGARQNLIPNIFERGGPFDHPFFTNPFGGLSEAHPFGFSGRSPLMNTHPFGFPMGGSPVMNEHHPHLPIGGSPFMHVHPTGLPIGMSPFMNAHPPNFSVGASPDPNSPHPFGFGTNIPLMNVQPSDFLEQRTCQTNKSKGPIIEELNSDEEKEIDGKEEKKHNPRKHDRSIEEACVEDQDYQLEGRNKKQIHYCNEFKSAKNIQPHAQGHSFTFQSSTVVHGGSNGAYYTKSRTVRTGSDGLTIDESKEADSTTGQAAHRLSRGIHNKGHTVARNLQSNGKVDTMQILHNLDKDDLAGFEETWKVNARKSLPGWSEGLYVQNGSGNSEQAILQSRGPTLPSIEGPHISWSIKGGWPGSHF